jgi:hypothetical protein
METSLTPIDTGQKSASGPSRYSGDSALDMSSKLVLSAGSLLALAIVT